jgi:hypothetical protein
LRHQEVKVAGKNTGFKTSGVQRSTKEIKGSRAFKDPRDLMSPEQREQLRRELAVLARARKNAELSTAALRLK